MLKIKKINSTEKVAPGKLTFGRINNYNYKQVTFWGIVFDYQGWLRCLANTYHSGEIYGRLGQTDKEKKDLVVMLLGTTVLCLPDDSFQPMKTVRFWPLGKDDLIFIFDDAVDTRYVVSMMARLWSVWPVNKYWQEVFFETQMVANYLLPGYTKELAVAKSLGLKRPCWADKEWVTSFFETLEKGIPIPR